MFKKQKEKVHHFFVGGEQFKKEVKRQVRLLIVVTLGFTIAFSWRQTIFDVFESFIQKIFPTNNTALSSILTSTLITLITLFLILITSYFLQEKRNTY